LLSIYFGYKGVECEDPHAYFVGAWEDEWFDDPIVKQMVLDVDKTEIVSPNLAISPVFGAMDPMRISGGVKSLILMYKDREFIADGESMGDNCYDWVVKLSHICDCAIAIEVSVLIGELENDQSPFNAVIENNGHAIKTVAEYYDEYHKWLAENHEKIALYGREYHLNGGDEV
jgi:hypothetical protein